MRRAVKAERWKSDGNIIQPSHVNTPHFVLSEADGGTSQKGEDLRSQKIQILASVPTPNLFSSFSIAGSVYSFRLYRPPAAACHAVGRIVNI